MKYKGKEYTLEDQQKMYVDFNKRAAPGALQEKIERLKKLKAPMEYIKKLEKKLEELLCIPE